MVSRVWQSDLQDSSMSENMIVDTAIDGLTEEASAGGRGEGGREGGRGREGKGWRKSGVYSSTGSCVRMLAAHCGCALPRVPT